MKRINDYKLVIITSNADLKYLGNIKDDLLHSQLLKEYIEINYKEIKVSDKISLTEMTELLTKHGNILVFNLTGIDKQGFGIISSPREITSNQNEKVNELLNNLTEFELEFEYENNGEYETYEDSSDDNFEEIRSAFEKITKKSKKK